MRGALFSFQVLLGSSALVLFSLALSADEMHNHRQAVLLHQQYTYQLPGLDSTPRMLVAVVFLALVVGAGGYRAGVSGWGVGVAFLLGGALANMASMQVYGGVVDFLPLGRLYLSPGDVLATCALFVFFVAGRRHDRRHQPRRLRRSRRRVGRRAWL